jgi:glycosyltransferase involved in cell wall biosynthesis
MRVVYVSKAMVVPAYRDKLRCLAQKLEVTAVVPTRWGSEVATRNAEHNFELRTIPVWFSGYNHLHLYRGITRVLGQLEPDLVHIDEEPYSAVTTQLVRACHALGVPTVFFAWQNLRKRLPPPFGAARAFVFRYAAGGIAGTQRAADVLRAANYRGPLAIIPQMGVDPELFAPSPATRQKIRAELGYAENDFVIGFGGRLVREKGVHLLIDAAAALVNAQLIIIGSGPERAALEAQVRRVMPGAVRFTDAVDSTAMPRWLNALDVLVLPSLTTPRWMEQFGRILVEAMACGVPVIGAASGEIPHVIGDAGLTFPEGNTARLTEALRALQTQADRRTLLGGQGRKRVLDRFTQSHVVDNTVTFYQEVIAR